MKIQVSEKCPANAMHVRLLTEEVCPVEGLSKDAFSGKQASACLRHGEPSVLHVGLGKAESVSIRRVREAGGIAVRRMLDEGQERLAIECPDYPDFAGALVEGVIMGAYKFETFLPKDKLRKQHLRALTLVCPAFTHKKVRKAASRAQVLAEATNLTREVGNLPANVLTPAELARRAQVLARAHGLSCKVWNEAALRKEGFGGILAVGQGSDNPPRLIRLDYRCEKKNAPTLAVVGKAITFDTGGISIKPGAQMDEMKFDKMGGCAVLGIMQAVAALELPVNVVGFISSAENMPSARSYRPGDIVTSWDGQTIEVLNTDAEGRIVLADALAYAREKVKPDFMIDMATLTGACVVALGMDRAGLFSADESAVDALRELGEETGDRLWHMPMGEEFDDMVRSEIASVKNLGSGRWGGASSAASFLKNWVGDIPWAHLDIAGTAWITAKKPHLEIGATGFGVRLVTAFAETFFAGRGR